MIERLLLVLDSAALLGKAPPPADFFQQRPKVNKIITFLP